MMNAIDGILNAINGLTDRVKRLELTGHPRWVYLTAPLTSASWDGDSYSTTAKTLIDLSAVFTVPAYVKAVLVKTAVNDSGSAAGNCLLRLAPNNTADQGLCNRCSGIANDAIHEECFVVPCSANGDIYYQIDASGASTMDIIIQVWGYMI